MSDIPPKITTDPPEQALIGWQSIASFFNCSSSLIRSRRQELISNGVIFYRQDHNNGKRKGPGNHRPSAFPSMLMRWVSLRGKL